jgi:hypothetical protein
VLARASKQQFLQSVSPVSSSCISIGRYKETTSEQTEGYMCAVVVAIYSVFESVKLLYVYLYAVTSYKLKKPNYQF